MSSNSLTEFSIDDGPHNMDGLRLLAQDGNSPVEAFVTELLDEVSAEPVREWLKARVETWLATERARKAA